LAQSYGVLWVVCNNSISVGHRRYSIVAISLELDLQLPTLVTAMHDVVIYWGPAARNIILSKNASALYAIVCQFPIANRSCNVTLRQFCD